MKHIVTFTEEEIKAAADFAKRKAEAKAKEKKHDKAGLYQRCFRGILGEIAVEKGLSICFIDWTIGDDSYVYDKPDIPQLLTGIKTREWGKEPLIWKNNSYGQIICTHTIFEGEDVVIIEGYASPELLNTEQDDSKVINPEVRKKGKTAFTGMDKLQDVDEWLKEAVKAQ